MAATAAVVLACGLAGCASDTTATTEVPACARGEHGTAAHGVVLMAQSVPTASWVPCMRTALPLGWRFQQLDARNDVSRFWLDSDRDGERAIEVRLTRGCAIGGATEIPSDRDRMRRLERVAQTTPAYRGERYYVFAGGCLTFVFDLRGDSPGEALALAGQSVGVIGRAELAAQVRDDSGDRLWLDPRHREAR